MSYSSLSGRVALVAGATRGAGRGIACALGEAGATVYCTGRSSRANRQPQKPSEGSGEVSPFVLEKRPETIEETAELVTAAGGTGIGLRVDHTVEEEVVGLFDRIRADEGRLDILVNDVWGGDALTEWGKPFWELNPTDARTLLDRSVWSHILSSRYGAPMMVEQGSGLIVEITDTLNFSYKSQLYYDLVKLSVMRLAFGMAEELRSHGITSLAVTPGFLRSEAMLEHFGVTEENWRDAAEEDRHFLHSETPAFVGRAVAALAADPEVFSKTGGIFSSWGLSREYGFTDKDGRRPDFGAYVEASDDEELVAMLRDMERSEQAWIGAMQTMGNR